MTLEEIKKQMHNRELYLPTNEELVEDQMAAMETLYDFNHTRPSQGERRQELMKKMFASMGEGCYIEPPLRSNWGGRHVTLGKGVYANFNLTLVDDTWIRIGDHVMIAPNVTIATAGHPVQPVLRKKQAQFNAAVEIGNNVWLGAGAVVLPGVTIGENTVIGAGSVVTSHIPANVVAVGNPCRVIREISGRDDKYYFKDLEIPEDFFD